MDEELNNREIWLSLHVRRSFPEQDFHMLLSSNGKHILHQPPWTRACKWHTVHYQDFCASVKKLPVSIMKRWFIQGTSLKIRWHLWSHPPLQISSPLSHQQMLLVSQQIKLSLNVTGDISHAAAILCSNWFFFHLLTLKGIRAQALLQLPRNCS